MSTMGIRRRRDGARRCAATANATAWSIISVSISRATRSPRSDSSRSTRPSAPMPPFGTRFSSTASRSARSEGNPVVRKMARPRLVRGPRPSRARTAAPSAATLRPPPPPKSPEMSPSAAKRAVLPFSFTPIAFTPAPPTIAIPTPSLVATRRPASESFRVESRFASRAAPRPASAPRTAFASRGVSIPAMQSATAAGCSPRRFARASAASMPERSSAAAGRSPIPWGLLPPTRTHASSRPLVSARMMSVFELPPSTPTISSCAARAPRSRRIELRFFALRDFARRFVAPRFVVTSRSPRSCQESPSDRARLR